MNKKKRVLALASIVAASLALAMFIVAADEQTVRSSGLPEARRMRLQELIEKGPGKNKHIEIDDFAFGTNFIYTAKVTQFHEVYLPLFPRGSPEDGSNLRFLLWVRNDQNSNLPLIEDRQTLEKFVADLNAHPKPIAGVLRKPMESVKKLTVEAYPNVDQRALQVLWARRFPSQESINNLWALWGLSLLVAGICAVLLLRKRY